MKNNKTIKIVKKSEKPHQFESNPANVLRLQRSEELSNMNNVRRHSVFATSLVQPEQQIISQNQKSLPKYKIQIEKVWNVQKHVHDINEQGKVCEMLEHNYLMKSSYRYLNMVGKGGFGKVWKVQHKYSSKVFAMKQINKAMQNMDQSSVITKRSVESILNERQFLATIRHRFIVNMMYAFQDEDNLYIVMNLMEGGDLRYHLSKMTIFSEAETKFMIASIILALEYLHSKMILHRDVKPQNIVFDKKGYAYLTDMGIAKYLRVNNSEDTSGTPGYMAPEVMFHHNHRFQVDFYAIGVILFQIIIGKRPYLGKNRQEIKLKIKQKQILIHKTDIPDGWTIEAADFTNKLLQRKPVERLGWGGINEIKLHPWLKHFPWSDLMSGKLQSPMKRYYNHMEVRYRLTENDTNYNKLLDKNREMLKKGSMQDYFNGYTYEDEASTAQNTKVY